MLPPFLRLILLTLLTFCSYRELKKMFVINLAHEVMAYLVFGYIDV